MDAGWEIRRQMEALFRKGVPSLDYPIGRRRSCPHPHRPRPSRRCRRRARRLRLRGATMGPGVSIFAGAVFPRAISEGFLLRKSSTGAELRVPAFAAGLPPELPAYRKAIKSTKISTFDHTYRIALYCIILYHVVSYCIV